MLILRVFSEYVLIDNWYFAIEIPGCPFKTRLEAP